MYYQSGEVFLLGFVCWVFFLFLKKTNSWHLFMEHTANIFRFHPMKNSNLP